MPIVDIVIRERRAVSPKDQRIVCGNSDYKILFDFDEEWNDYKYKTARFKINAEYIDVVFEGNVCDAPPLYDSLICTVGVFAGDIATTTPAVIILEKSILCDSGAPVEPKEDVYNQIMSLLNQLKEGEISAEDIQKAVDQFLTENPVEVGGVVRYDVAQELTEDEKQRAKDNMGLADINFTTDETLSLKDGVLSVNTASDAEVDNTLPITSAAVATTVGNIEILLQTI